jgi:hypothetical protein
MDVMCCCHPCLSRPRKTSESVSHGAPAHRSCRAHTNVTTGYTPLNCYTDQNPRRCLWAKSSRHGWAWRKQNWNDREIKLLVIIVRPRFNDPLYQRSAMSISKQHWPLVMTADSLETALADRHVSARSVVSCLQAHFQYHNVPGCYLHALTCWPEIKIWQQCYILQPELKIYHITGGRGQGSLWRFYCRQKASS